MPLVAKDVALPDLAKQLDAMTHTDRLRALWTIPRRDFGRIYDAAAGLRRISLEFAVPSSARPLEPIVHAGINSLAAFRGFAKPMYRTAGGGMGGRNVQTWEWLTGPGYFTVREDGAELLVDYVDLPREKPASWPGVASNARGFSFFVFRGLVDRLRGISEHVSIGKAYRNGKPQGDYFFLVREA
jgi:hypothetical protein